ncbi:MAG: pantetheine-phosphate adenylyltransferase [Caldilineales bacterium]|nr:pantetheine-phosphate adenylyltransferase [Caldilineales bacterium]MCX7852990.1 pantetheine-phosphate adenylyltransferase [Caldilineales bacterium]
MITALYPGTFDPVHNGHIDIARRSARLWDRLIVAVYDRPNKKLLFDAAERVALFAEAVRDIPNVEVVTYSGLTVEFARQVGARVMVRGLRAISDFEYEFQIALTNKELAPDIEFCALMTSLEHAFLSASILKEVALLGGDISGMCPPHVAEALRRRARERGLIEVSGKVERV